MTELATAYPTTFATLSHLYQLEGGRWTDNLYKADISPFPRRLALEVFTGEPAVLAALKKSLLPIFESTVQRDGWEKRDWVSIDISDRVKTAVGDPQLLYWIAYEGDYHDPDGVVAPRSFDILEWLFLQRKAGNLKPVEDYDDVDEEKQLARGISVQKLELIYQN